MKRSHFSHKKLVTILARRTDLHRDEVDSALKIFWGDRYGVKKYMQKNIEVSVRGIGNFILSRKGKILKARKEQLEKLKKRKRESKFYFKKKLL